MSVIELLAIPVFAVYVVAGISMIDDIVHIRKHSVSVRKNRKK